jgi:8-oxo-dGTP diphosphatase
MSQKTPMQSKECNQGFRVVAALLEDLKGRVLIAQRNETSFMPLMWEFPGGKVEPGETDAFALQREIKEELGIEISVQDEFISSFHKYTNFDIDFHVYRCRFESGKLKCLGVKDFRWVTIAELEKYKFPPADQTTISRLLSLE